MVKTIWGTSLLSQVILILSIKPISSCVSLSPYNIQYTQSNVFGLLVIILQTEDVYFISKLVSAHNVF